MGRATYGRLGRKDVNPDKDERHWQVHYIYIYIYYYYKSTNSDG
jgi:hypothetical protein